MKPDTRAAEVGVNLGEDITIGVAAPVLAVCGFSGAGKTTLLESAIPHLVHGGLRVAVVKHDAHGFEVDRPGKDSDRLFRAGATIVLGSATQQFERRAAPLPLQTVLKHLAVDHDVILVEGHKDTALPKLWLQDSSHAAAPAEVSGITATLPWNSDRLSAFLEYFDRWLPASWRSRPLYGGLLLGGKSSRMGEPKQLLHFGERTLGEVAACALRAELGQTNTVALGSGALSSAMSQLPDSPGLAGPAAALISAHRWAPSAAWIVAACDHPWLRVEHIAWLAAQRKPGCWAVIPRQSDGHCCPTLALYEPQALEALDRKSSTEKESSMRPLALLEMPQTLIVEPPAELADGWKNVNTPEELQAEERLLAKRSSDLEGAEWKSER